MNALLLTYLPLVVFIAVALVILWLHYDWWRDHRDK